MEELINILERKWKLMKYSFHYGNRKDLPVLFTDYQDFIKQDKAFSTFANKLKAKEIIPNDFFERKDLGTRKPQEDSIFHDPIRDDFQMFHRIHSSLITEIEIQELEASKEQALLEDKEHTVDIIDFKQPPKKYSYNEDSLTSGKYLDDNSLYLFFLLSKNVLCEAQPVMSFIYFNPFEWSSSNYIAFLIKTYKEYNLTIKNIHTEIGAIQDDYEISKGFSPIYQWYLNKKDDKELLPEVELLLRLEEDRATVDDIEQALIYSTRIASTKDDGSKEYITKHLFLKFLDYTSFSICAENGSRKNLQKDLGNYLQQFIDNKLKRSSSRHHVYNTSVEQPRNISTYKYQHDELKKYLLEQSEKYGQKLMIPNIFEEDFPNVSPSEISSEYIRKRYRERDKLFFHTLLAFHHQKLVKVHLIRNNWSIHEDEDYKHLCEISILSSLVDETTSQKTTKNQRSLATEDASSKYSPFLVTENKKGYLKLSKHSERIFIGGMETRKFKLMRALMEPEQAMSARKSIEMIFNQIRIDKDKNNERIKDEYTGFEERLKIIQHTIKDLQKIKKLQGKMKFDFSPNKQQLRILFN